MAIERETVVFFDIRNFSVHRLTLGERRHAKVMTELVRSMLNHAVEILRRFAVLIGNASEPLLNHTGDGFVLVVRGADNPILALLWISKFEKIMSAEMKEYHRNIRSLLGEHGLPDLDYGIGVHYGPVSIFHFKAFTDKKSRQSRTGFLGTPANIASRVEQRTKDLPYRVLYTRAAMERAVACLSEEARPSLVRRFAFAGAQDLPGIPKSYELYGLTGSYHSVFKRRMLKNKAV